MIAQERFQAISTLLAKQQKLTVHELQRELQISPATLRRDLAELEASGKLIRVRGAVVHPDYFRGEPTLVQKSRVEIKAKRTMAVAAAALVPAGASLFLDAGSTCVEVARLLLPREDLTLFTHSLPIAMMAYPNSAKVVCLGGEVRSISGAVVGALALSWVKSLRADIAILSASGLSKAEGASTTELAEAAVKTEILQRVKTRILIADAAKWEKPTAVNFASWSYLDLWITEGNHNGEDLKNIKKQGPKIITAD